MKYSKGKSLAEKPDYSKENLFKGEDYTLEATILRRHKVVAAGVPLLLVSGALMLHFFPVGTLPYPPCPWFALTGTFCPGCGVTRAASAFATGDPMLALRQNVMLLPAVIYLSWMYLRLLASLKQTWVERLPAKVSNALLSPLKARPKTIMLVFIVVVSWWVLRNIPYFSMWAPLPVTS